MKEIAAITADATINGSVMLRFLILLGATIPLVKWGKCSSISYFS